MLLKKGGTNPFSIPFHPIHLTSHLIRQLPSNNSRPIYIPQTPSFNYSRTDGSLKFITAKYFNRQSPITIPELLWYTTLSLPLPAEGLFPDDFTQTFESKTNRAFEGILTQAIEGFVLSEPRATRKKVVRRLSVSSSESD